MPHSAYFGRSATRHGVTSVVYPDSISLNTAKRHPSESDDVLKSRNIEPNIAIRTATGVIDLQ